MVATEFLNRRFGTILILCLTLFACTTPRDNVRTETYHEPEPDKEMIKALNALQLKALGLMNEGRFRDAIHYLQRAIKIEPRNALSWHYLAQNYWHLQEFKTCRSMIQRSRDYTEDEDLGRANDHLFKQCAA